jgi:hypothetical protein
MSTKKKFPLEQWFDVSRSISRIDANKAEAQMALYAAKDGIDPASPEAKDAYREMRLAVKEHNEKLRSAPGR